MTLEEMENAPPEVHKCLETLPRHAVERIAVTPEEEALAAEYISAGALGQASIGDASHVAAATVAGADLILSLNFRHIVNYQRIRKFNAVNLMNGYNTLDIRSPWELQYGDEDQDV